MRVICCQLDIVWESPQDNHRCVDSMLSSASIGPGSLIVLPEMFATGFSMDVDAVADQDSQTQSFVCGLAKRHNAHVVAGLATRDADGRGRNEAMVAGPSGREIARYCKLHPFSYAGETDHFRSGQSVVTFDVGSLTVSPLICYDLRFPEAFRRAVVRGAHVLCVIANWPAVRAAHWDALLTARAIENQAYVIGVNRCGSDPNHRYPGHTRVISPTGELLADAGDGPGLLSARLDIESLRAYRQAFPALSDIRPDLLGGS